MRTVDEDVPASLEDFKDKVVLKICHKVAHVVPQGHLAPEVLPKRSCRGDVCEAEQPSFLVGIQPSLSPSQQASTTASPRGAVPVSRWKAKRQPTLLTSPVLPVWCLLCLLLGLTVCQASARSCSAHFTSQRSLKIRLYASIASGVNTVESGSGSS